MALLSCGKEEDQAAAVLSVEPVFASYVQGFESASAEFGSPLKVSNLVVRFGPVQRANERGACEINPGQPPTIIVNQEKWDRLTELEREEFMYHEMGHCVLRRLHKSALHSGSGRPVSIMHPVAMSATTYNSAREAYLGELFGSQNEF